MTTRNETLSAIDELLESIKKDMNGVLLTPRQSAIADSITDALNDDFEIITELSDKLNEKCGDALLLTVLGASIQLLLNAINACSEQMTLVEKKSGDVSELISMTHLEARIDTAAAVCNIINATIETPQGLEENE